MTRLPTLAPGAAPRLVPRTNSVALFCRANVAAVSYHFGGKEDLYAAALEDCARSAIAKYPPDLGVSADAPAEKRLHAFVRSLLLRMLGA